MKRAKMATGDYPSRSSYSSGGKYSQGPEAAGDLSETAKWPPGMKPPRTDTDPAIDSSASPLRQDGSGGVADKPMDSPPAGSVESGAAKANASDVQQADPASPPSSTPFWPPGMEPSGGNEKNGKGKTEEPSQPSLQSQPPEKQVAEGPAAAFEAGARETLLEGQKLSGIGSPDASPAAAPPEAKAVSPPANSANAPSAGNTLAPVAKVLAPGNPPSAKSTPPGSAFSSQADSTAPVASPLAAPLAQPAAGSPMAKIVRGETQDAPLAQPVGSKKIKSIPKPSPADEAAKAIPDEEEGSGQESPGVDLWKDAGACVTSMAVHLVALILLALWMLPPIVPALAPELQSFALEELESEDLTTILEEELEPDPDFEDSEATAGLTAGTIGSTLAGGAFKNPSAEAVSEFSDRQAQANDNPSFEGLLEGVPGTAELVSSVPKGTMGDPREVVSDYAEAMDRITQEIVMMLSESKVLVVWCFDQSGSMKDDQEEIRNRIELVYTELGLRSEADGDQLATAVISYGKDYVVHTKHPTSNIEEIKSAIDAVPVDPSGKEMMCQAIGETIHRLRDVARKGRRKMALVVVTDESGDPQNNRQYLEGAVDIARDTDSRIYILGREAVFGYPYAHIEWRHPQSGGLHYLPVDRGPETGFVEQLQTDGFRKRMDAHASGFGPYEQSRLARESGGIFFMLPSVESELHKKEENRRYQSESMRAYLPDVSSRKELASRIQSNVLRSVLVKIVNDMNPYRDEVAKIMEVKYRFDSPPQNFAAQVRVEQEKVKKYLAYLDAAANALEEVRPYREKELNARWQANYDLIYAQIIAYTARTYEYGAYLEYFLKNPKKVPAVKPNFMEHRFWNIEPSIVSVGGDLSMSYIERSTKMFNALINEHPDTPWAARAELELQRGFGWEFFPGYRYNGPRRRTESRPSAPRIPIPKL